MDVDFETKKATVRMQPGRNLTAEACNQAFTGTKYKVALFEESKG